MGLLASLAPPGVSSGIRRVTDPHPPLWPEEAAYTHRMSPLRLREFRAGRAAAREAFTALGLPAAPILVEAGRGPTWPQGMVGSITHTATMAAAMVTHRQRCHSLGLDLEEDDGLESRLLPMVCRAEEMARLPGAGPAAAGVAKLIFSAKEAAYKCLSPLFGIFLEFHDLEIRLQPDHQAFSVMGHGPRTRHMPIPELHGCYGKDDGMLVTVCWLAAGDSRTPHGEDWTTGHRCGTGGDGH